MAAGKQDSRQKMINMMYLVFIAMLALNISKEVLATLGILNNDIEISISSKFEKSQNLYKSFEQNKSNPSYLYATKYSSSLKEKSDEYFNYIKGIKDYLLSKGEKGYMKQVEGIPDSIMDYQKMDKSLYLDEYFFLGDSLTNNGAEYVNRFNEFSSFFKSLIDSIVSQENLEDKKTVPHDLSQVKYLLETSFNYEDKVINSEGKKQNYLNYNFEGFPKIASISKFTKLQSDIREIELQMVEAFNTKILSDGSAVNINTSKSLLNAKSTYFVGERVNDAKILIGRIASSFEPDSIDLFINGKKLGKSEYETKDGAVVLNKIFRRSGEMNITGNLFFNDSDGNSEAIPVDETLVVNTRTDFFIEVPTMNILYRGLPNEIRVIDPEISQSNMRVSSNSAEIISVGNSSYDVVPNDTAKEIIVTVRDKSNASVRKTKNFRVKNFPPMIPAISYNNRQYTRKTGIPKTALQRGRVTGSTPKDFDYPLTIEVTSFTFQIGNSPSVKVNSDNLKSAFSSIQASEKGTIASFTNVVSTAYYIKRGRRFPIKNQKLEDFFIKVL